MQRRGMCRQFQFMRRTISVTMRLRGGAAWCRFWLVTARNTAQAEACATGAVRECSVYFHRVWDNGRREMQVRTTSSKACRGGPDMRRNLHARGRAESGGVNFTRRNLLQRASWIAGAAMIPGVAGRSIALAADNVRPVMAKLSAYMSEAADRALPEQVIE